MSDQVFNLNSNVTIKVFNKKDNRLKSLSKIHNKATDLMVQGILQYLQGNFTGSQANKTYNQESNAWRYVPCYISLGDGGTNVNSVSHSFIEYDIHSNHAPTYKDRSLVRFLDSAKIDRSIQTQDNLHQDSGAILLKAIFDKSQLFSNRFYNVTRVWDGQSLPTTKTGCLITELGLMSGPDENSNLLARVALNSTIDENYISIFNNVDGTPTGGYPIRSRAVNPDKAPIFKTEDEYIVVEWRIGVISIGSNDIVTITTSNI